MLNQITKQCNINLERKMKYKTQNLLCALGCQHCIDSEACSLENCDEMCEGINKSNQCCSECGTKKNYNSSSNKKNKFIKGTCRHCGGKDDYAYVSSGDGMICCWLCKLEGKG
jgi:hypothetical protein